jgi:hypothetical protein
MEDVREEAGVYRCLGGGWGGAGGSEGRNGCVGDANYVTARDEQPILMGSRVCVWKQ